MTVHSNLSSTRFSSLAPTPAAEKPAAPGSPSATPQARGTATQALPPAPAGLVGHNVNTTA